MSNNKRVYLYDLGERDFIVVNSRGIYTPDFLTQSNEEFTRNLQTGDLYITHDRRKEKFYEIAKVVHEAQTRKSQRITKKIIFLNPLGKKIFDKNKQYLKAINVILST